MFSPRSAITARPLGRSPVCLPAYYLVLCTGMNVTLTNTRALLTTQETPMSLGRASSPKFTVDAARTLIAGTLPL